MSPTISPSPKRITLLYWIVFFKGFIYVYLIANKSYYSDDANSAYYYSET